MSEEIPLKEKAPPAGGWTDKEIAAFGNRVGRFTKAGMDDMAAEQLAQQMLYRDRPESGDDRRICVECKGFALKRMVCTFANRMGLRAGMEPVWNVLQRCDGFTLRGAA